MLARNLGTILLATFTGYAVLPDLMERRSPASLRRLPSRDAVALTFDDGPHPELTPRVLESLRRFGAHATFFVVGAAAAAYPELLRRIVQEGHAVGVHTATHRHAWLCTPARTRQEITAGWQAIVSGTAGQRPLWFRPPYGAFNALTRRQAARWGLRVALWSCDAGDWLPGTSGQAILRRVRAGLQPGAVIDLHDGGRTPRSCQQMVEVLPEILATMRSLGLRGVHLGEPFGLPALLPPAP